MPLSTATIHWDTPIGSKGVLVEYRKKTDNAWTKPTNPTNPTMEGSYPLLLETGVEYYARISSQGTGCTPRYIYQDILITSNNCCPVGYTLSPDSTYCYKVEQVAATAPSSSTNAVSRTHGAYSACGTYIYDLGYSSNGTGTSTQITMSNSFWRNTSTVCLDGNTTEGPLNRTGIWSPSALDNQDIGFGVCLELPNAATYYVGMGCDNYGIIKVDGSIIVQQDADALATQYGVGLAATFKVWHVYPVQLTAGPHFLEIYGHNVSSAAAVGCEIYNATPADLIAASSYAALGSKLIFSSKDYIGQPIQFGTGGVGYTCPATYSISNCDGSIPVCKRILTSSTTSC